MVVITNLNIIHAMNQAEVIIDPGLFGSTHVKVTLYDNQIIGLTPEQIRLLLIHSGFCISKYMEIEAYYTSHGSIRFDIVIELEKDFLHELAIRGTTAYMWGYHRLVQFKEVYLKHKLSIMINDIKMGFRNVPR